MVTGRRTMFRDERGCSLHAECVRVSSKEFTQGLKNVNVTWRFSFVKKRRSTQADTQPPVGLLEKIRSSLKWQDSHLNFLLGFRSTWSSICSTIDWKYECKVKNQCYFVREISCLLVRIIALTATRILITIMNCCNHLSVPITVDQTSIKRQ